MTTHVRFDDATFADIQKRFREGRPSEAAKRKRHSRCDLIASLRTEIELLLSEGYSFEGIAEYLATIDVIIPVPTLKNYIGRARKKSGDTRRQPAHSDRRNSRTATSEHPPKAARTRGREARHRESDSAPPPVATTVTVADSRSEQALAVADTQQSHDRQPPENSPGTGPDAPEDGEAPLPHDGRTPPDRRPPLQQNPAATSSEPPAPPAPTEPADLGRPGDEPAELRAEEPLPRIATGAGPETATASRLVRSTPVTARDEPPRVRDSEREPPLNPAWTPLEDASEPASPLHESSSSFAVPRRKRLEDL